MMSNQNFHQPASINRSRETPVQCSGKLAKRISPSVPTRTRGKFISNEPKEGKRNEYGKSYTLLEDSKICCEVHIYKHKGERERVPRLIFLDSGTTGPRARERVTLISARREERGAVSTPTASPHPPSHPAPMKFGGGWGEPPPPRWIAARAFYVILFIIAVVWLGWSGVGFGWPLHAEGHVSSFKKR